MRRRISHASMSVSLWLAACGGGAPSAQPHPELRVATEPAGSESTTRSESTTNPSLREASPEIALVGAADGTMCALRDRTVWCWAYEPYADRNDGTPPPTSPVRLDELSPVRGLTSTDDAIWATRDGEASYVHWRRDQARFVWESRPVPRESRSGDGSCEWVGGELGCDRPEGFRWSGVRGYQTWGDTWLYAARDDGAFCMDRSVPHLVTELRALSGAFDVHATARDACGAFAEGHVVCVGFEHDASITSEWPCRPWETTRGVVIEGIRNVARLAEHCAIERDGTVLCWDTPILHGIAPTPREHAVAVTPLRGSVDVARMGQALVCGIRPSGPVTCVRRDSVQTLDLPTLDDGR